MKTTSGRSGAGLRLTSVVGLSVVMSGAGTFLGAGVLSLHITQDALADAPAPEAVSLTGRWEGSISLPGTKLAVQLDFSADDAGVISIPAQGAKDLPLEKITRDGAKATFSIRGVPGSPTFSGTIDGTTLKGDFKQGGATFPFELTRAPGAAEASADALAGFGEWVEEARAAWDVPGVAVAIVRDGKTVFSRGFGLRDVEGKKPVTEDTLFPIGSATKAFTSFVLATLVDQGRLEWDAPVTRFMPEFRTADAAITSRISARDLVTHRSGLPRHDLTWYNAQGVTRQQLVERIAHLKLSKDLREAWQYNNLMYLTAGVLGERLTGKTWEENVRERIFTPLGMKRSVFTIADMEKDADFSRGYREDDESFVVEPMAFRDISIMGPAGSIASSVREMAAWAMLNLGDGELARGSGLPGAGTRLLGAELMRDMHTPQMAMGGGSPESPEIVPVGYAMGWFVDVYRGHRRVHHGGNIDGFSALVTLLPSDGVGIVVLANKNGTALPGLIVRHATDRLLGLEQQDWSARALETRAVARSQGKQAKDKLGETRREGTRPSVPLAEFVGEYEHPGYGVLRVNLLPPSGTTQAEALSFTYNAITTPLEHWHFDVFKGTKNAADRTFDSFRVQFLLSPDGDVESVRATMDPSVEMITFRRLGDRSLRDPAVLERFVGDYLLMGTQRVSIARTDSTLTAIVPGQPAYELIPTRDNTFRLKGLDGFRVRFKMPEGAQDAKAAEVEFLQPNGVFSGKRVE